MGAPGYGIVNNSLPSAYATEVTPHDTTVISPPSRSLYVGATGDLTVTMEGGGDVLFKAVPAGVTLPIRVTKVKSTGTTATNIVALY